MGLDACCFCCCGCSCFVVVVVVVLVASPSPSALSAVPILPWAGALSSGGVACWFSAFCFFFSPFFFFVLAWPFPFPRLLRFWPLGVSVVFVLSSGFPPSS